VSKRLVVPLLCYTQAIVIEEAMTAIRSGLEPQVLAGVMNLRRVLSNGEWRSLPGLLRPATIRFLGLVGF
jgi:hypothetical protein